MDRDKLARRKKALREFGARLKACRIAAGYESARDFVKSFPESVGLEEPAYRRYERGEVLPDAYVLPLIAGKVHKSVDFLLTGRSRPADLPPTD
jgi:transcriptional regulator with XRE-family HTH domain